MLFLFIRNNYLDLVKFLAEGKHCNLEAKNSEGETPLHVAARYSSKADKIVRHINKIGK